MRWRIVRTIALKELLESFRDRRTLFLMVFLPILLYPALLLIVTQVALIQAGKLEEQRSRVAWVPPNDHPLTAFLEEDERLDLSSADRESAMRRLRSGELDAVLDLAEWPADLQAPATGRAVVHYVSIEETSSQAADRLEERLAEWEEAELAARLEAFGVPPSLVEPADVTLTDTSDPTQRGGFALAAFLPMIVIATVLLGAYYPAIDLTAGEKERGSIQTLFTAPITPFEIVAGKYVAVLGIALVSGLANLLSMALLFSHNLFLGGAVEGLSSQLDFSLSAGVLLAMLLAIVMMALFFASLLLAVAVLARSYKEGQNYVTPVYLALILPAAVAQMPGFELSWGLALVPGINVTLLMKQVLVEGVDFESLFVVGASTLVYTALVLGLASRLFGQERVILGERGSFALMLRRSGGERERRPTLGEGIGLYGVLFVVLFYAGSLLQARHLQLGLLATLWLLLLTPTALLTRWLRLDPRETFHLTRPSSRGLLAAAVLGISGWAVVAWINTFIERWFLPPPTDLYEAMGELFPRTEGVGDWAWVLLLVAVSPAICEEALFRGFLFSSLRQRVRPWLLVGITALLFGIFHLSAFRLFGTTALGVLMGLLVYKTGSIWTSVLFHALSNASVLIVLTLLDLPMEAGTGMPTWLVAAGFGGVALGLALLWPLRSPFNPAAAPP